MPTSPPNREAYWRAVRCWTLGLLLVWAGVTFGVAFEARALDFTWFGWPFSFWVAAQGGAIVFVVLIAVYARRMAHHDRALAGSRGETAAPAAHG